MKHLKLLTPACGLNRSIFIFFALVLVMLACLPAQVQAASWSTKYHGWQVACSVEHPFLEEWTNFEVEYSIKKDENKYSVRYECDKNPFYKKLYACKIKDKNLPSDLSPGGSASLELTPGTWFAQKYVCKEIFKKTME